VKENTNKTRKDLFMPKISKTAVDADLRTRVFDWLMADTDSDDTEYEIAISTSMQKINDRQYGCILVDKNGVERYCRVGVIVAEEREDMTARELMAREIDEYNAKQASKAEKARVRAEKAEKDKAKREKEKEA
jgi:hypothetical protein